MRKFNVFSYWLTARVKKKNQLFSTSVVLEDRWLLLKVRFFLPVCKTNSDYIVLICTSDG